MAEIIVEDITSGVIDGTGVFDKLMTSTTKRLTEQFELGRLRGADYAKVYLGGMEASMQQSISFLLARQQADKEAELTSEQITSEQINQELLQAQIAKLAVDSALVTAKLITEQKTNLQQDASLEKTNKENALLDIKLLYEDRRQVAEIEYLEAKAAAETAQLDLILSQITKSQSEIELINAQIAVASTQQKKLNAETVILDITALHEEDRQIAEVNILQIKAITEQFQQDLIVSKIAKSQSDIELTNAQISVTTTQQKKLNAETVILDIKAGFEGDRQQAEINILQIKAITEQVQQDLIQKQVTKLDSDIELTNAEIVFTGAKGQVAQQEILVKEKEIEIATENLELTEAKKWTERANTSANPSSASPPSSIQPGSALGTQVRVQTTQITTEGYKQSLLEEQKMKATQEIALLNQKQITETAQTSGSGAFYDDNGNWYEGTVGGVLGRQIALYSRQTEGFARDAEQKFAKLYTDMWNVQRSTDSAFQSSVAAKNTNNAVGQVLQKAASGLGVTLVP